MADTYYPRTAATIEAHNGDLFVNTVHSGGSADIWFNIPTLFTKDIAWTIYNGPETDVSWHIFPETIASVMNFLMEYVRFSTELATVTSNFEIDEVLKSNFVCQEFTAPTVSLQPIVEADTITIPEPMQTNFTLKHVINRSFSISRVAKGSL